MKKPAALISIYALKKLRSDSFFLHFPRRRFAPLPRALEGMEAPTMPDVNPYSEIWPLAHDAEIWRHRPAGAFRKEHMALDALGLVLPARMHERVIYAESFAHGKTAFEIDPKGVAANELSNIWIGVKGGITESKKPRKGEREKVA
jgi:hypothetical protein